MSKNQRRLFSFKNIPKLWYISFTLIAGLSSIIPFIKENHWWASILYILIAILIIITIISFVKALYKKRDVLFEKMYWILFRYFEKKQEISVYQNIKSVPPYFNFGNFEFIDNLTKGDCVELLARTAIQWFVGQKPENNSDIEIDRFEELKQTQQKKIIEAIKRGVEFKIYLQYLSSDVSLQLKKREVDQIEFHQKLSIESIKQIRDQLDINEKERLLYWYYKKPIPNSITYYKKNGNFGFLQYTLDMSFDAKKNAILILRNEKIAKKFINEIPGKGNKFLYTEDEYRHSIAIDEIKEICKEYEGYNKKNNSPENLLEHSIHCLTQGDENAKYPAPVSVQLLLTDKCLTNCKMCNHHNLKSIKTPYKTMSPNEICSVLTMISKMGTKSVIFSGGEPLSMPYSELKEIFEHAKSKEVGLNIGLLTSGVTNEGGEIDENLLDLLGTNCDWIQVSVDSFNNENYNKIRKSSKASYDNLINFVKRLSSKTEICFTIQKDNIDEIITDQISDTIKKLKYSSVKIRFKPVHGRNKEYVPNSQNFKDAIRKLHEKNIDSYLFESIENGNYFSYKNLGDGIPTADWIKRNSKYKCHGISQSLFIDSYGSVYPCCYLYDDNEADSEWRNQYYLGNLRQYIENKNPKDDDNVLQAIWNGKYDSYIKKYNYIDSNRTETLKNLRMKSLPIQEDACFKCTRYIRHNEFNNKLSTILEKYPDIVLKISNENPWKNNSVEKGDVKKIWV